MTILDPDPIDLLRRFRAAEGVLDDATRARMWARIGADVPDARAAFADLDAIGGSGAGSPRRRPTRVLAIAAAVLVLIAVAGVAVRAAIDDDSTVTAGPSTATTAPAITTMADLADAVAARDDTVLGSSPAARYSHWIQSDTRRSSTGDPTTVESEIWMDETGGGALSENGVLEEIEAGPDRSLYPGLPAPSFLDLADDADAAIAAFVEQARGEGPADDIEAFSGQALATLAITGVPAPARAGMIRMLDRAGFAVVPAGGSRSPNLVRIEGPGGQVSVYTEDGAQPPEEATLRADIDLGTGRVITWSSTTARTSQTVTYTDVDLRPDIDGP